MFLFLLKTVDLNLDSELFCACRGERSRALGNPGARIVSNWFQQKTIKVFLIGLFKFERERLNMRRVWRVRGCLHDTGATFAPRRVHSGSLSWLYICLHDTTTKSHAGASRPGVSSLRLSHRGENFTPVRNLATVSCKDETTTRFGVKSV